MKRAGYEIRASACILVQTVEPQSRGLDHGHIVLGHANRPSRASSYTGSPGSRRGMALVSLTDTAMRCGSSVTTRGQDRLSEPRVTSTYVSKERAADWLREEAGQRVFYVAPWLSQAAGTSMRIARLGRRLWASKHGYCERPSCTDEELEVVMKFLAARDGPPERAP